MTLMLHSGATAVDYQTLLDVPCPEATKTWLPIAHHRVVDTVKHALDFYKHPIAEESYGVTADGMKFFGLLSLRSPYGDYTDTVGLRNSHDQSFPISLGFGSRVFVCDNLAFSAETVIRRKHTQNAWRDLIGLFAQVIEKLQLSRDRQALQIEKYKTIALPPPMVDHAVVEMWRQGVINVTKIPAVLQEYTKPRHDEWMQDRAWTLFNGATQVLEGRVAEDPSITTRLHTIIDGVCERIAA